MQDFADIQSAMPIPDGFRALVSMQDVIRWCASPQGCMKAAEIASGKPWAELEPKATPLEWVTAISDLIGLSMTSAQDRVDIANAKGGEPDTADPLSADSTETAKTGS